MDSPFWWQDTTEDGVHVAFTSVRAGNLSLSVGSDGHKHRAQLEKQLGLTSGSLRFLQQVHSADVLDASIHNDSSDDDEPTGDAWISTHGSEPLAIMVADCMPVLFSARRPNGRIITAAAHAGRVGLLDGVLENVIVGLRSQDAESITAWIGPSACGRCYEVPQRMVDMLAADRPTLASTTSWGTPSLDLRAEAARVLRDSGSTVVDTGGCTIEDQSLFSHRRTQHSAAPAGRLAGIIWI